MEYGKMLGESIEYAKEAVWGKWTRWLLLVISTIIFPLLIGYTMEIYRGKRPAPEPDQWWKMFVDGLKLFVAAIIYAIPVFIVIVATIGYAIVGIFSRLPQGNPDYLAAHPEIVLGMLPEILPGILAGIVLTLIVAFIISLFATIAMVRLARTDRFGEAFNFGEILATIRKIGWGSYILALIVIGIVSFIFAVVIGAFRMIPYIGWLIWLIFMPVLSIFQARYITLLYENAEPAPAEVQAAPQA
ncbi:MAG: DUF4013 domain-containing protein [Methanoregulaceae archaeon]|nr:DUF4013 domain-containing protein [Methanoregulaceae archaeon]